MTQDRFGCRYFLRGIVAFGVGVFLTACQPALQSVDPGDMGAAGMDTVRLPQSDLMFTAWMCRKLGSSDN